MVANAATDGGTALAGVVVVAAAVAAPGAVLAVVAVAAVLPAAAPPAGSVPGSGGRAMGGAAASVLRGRGRAMFICAARAGGAPVAVKTTSGGTGRVLQCEHSSRSNNSEGRAGGDPTQAVQVCRSNIERRDAHLTRQAIFDTAQQPLVQG